MKPQKRKKVSEEEDEQTVGKKTAKMRRYRRNVKNDPERYEKAKEKDRKRKKKARNQEKEQLQKSEKMLEAHRAKKKEAQRRYRAKQKGKETEKQVAQGKGRKPKKDQLKKKLDEAERKKAVMRTQAWRMRVKLKKNKKRTVANPPAETLVVASPPGWSPFSSRWAEGRAARRVKASLPITPAKKAHLIEKMAESPTTREILEAKGVVMSPQAKKTLVMGQAVLESLKNDLEETKTGSGVEKKTAHRALTRAAVGTVAKKYRVSGRLKQLLKVRRPVNKPGEQWWKPQQRKKRKDRISDGVREMVKDFLLSPDISREVPCKREVLKVKDADGNTTRVQKHVMLMTLRESYDLFKKMNPTVKIGFTTYRSCRPPQVKRISETNRRTCLCQTCCNIALKAQALKQFGKTCTEEQMAERLSTKKDLADLTLCPYEDTPAAKCLLRTCDLCGTKKLSEVLKYSMLLKHGDDKLEWDRWEYVSILDASTGKEKRVISCVHRSNSTLADCITEAEKDLEDYPNHVFQKTWQLHQMVDCCDALGLGELMMVMDYAENYKCHFQDEVQSAYFDQTQVTIHPMMCYYKEEVAGEVVPIKHAIIGISNDVHHDSNGVKAFSTAALQLLSDQEDLNPTALEQWTDGCAAQYKGKNGFDDISRQHKCTRNFFVTSHGKSVCDGLGAVVKNSCYRAVLSGKRISNAEDFFDHCKKLQHGPQPRGTGFSKRHFVYIDESSVERARPSVQTLKGTRKLHVVRSTGQEHTLMTRNLSCYCQACCTNNPGECTNQEYVEAWSTKTMKVIHSEAEDQHPGGGVPPFPSPPHETVDVGNSDVHSNDEIESTTLAGTSVENEDPSVADQDQVSIGTFVAVKLFSLARGKRKRTAKVYLGEVLEVDIEDQVVHVKFMERRGRLFSWPTAEDFGWEPLANVVGTLAPPVLQNEREQFCFDEQDMGRIEHAAHPIQLA